MINANLDGGLKNFINQHVTSFLVWDLLVFFHKNPAAVDDVFELSKKIGRGMDDIELAASELVNKSILRREKKVYEYAASDEMKALVATFVGALDDRETRLWILSEVLQRR
ncbi:MAG TPA: hypothetical protein ENI11_03380 [Actinobacteria bacterium]|nr:hypothetical protein [Actinomycetota bacterium]